MKRTAIVWTAATICFVLADPGVVAQDRGVLAIGDEAGRHAFSFRGGGRRRQHVRDHGLQGCRHF